MYFFYSYIFKYWLHHSLFFLIEYTKVDLIFVSVARNVRDLSSLSTYDTKRFSKEKYSKTFLDVNI